MPRKCSVSGCQNGQGTNGITLHEFPKDPRLRFSWIAYLKRGSFEPSKSSVVCSIHFEKEDFEIGEKSMKNRVRTKLKKHAVPGRKSQVI